MSRSIRMASLAAAPAAPSAYNKIALEKHLHFDRSRRKWKLLKHYERHAIAPPPPALLMPPQQKQPKSLLELYISQTKATPVKVSFQSDDESESDESISIHAEPLEEEQDEAMLEEEDDYQTMPVSHLPRESSPKLPTSVRTSNSNNNSSSSKKPLTSQTTLIDLSAGDKEDPIELLSDSDDDSDYTDDEADEKPRAAARSPSASSPTSLFQHQSSQVVVTPTGHHHRTSSAAKGNTVTSESSSSDASSAMSSVFMPPNNPTPQCKIKLFAQGSPRFDRDEGASLIERIASHDFDLEENDTDDTESVDSEAVADEFYNSPPPEDPDARFSLQDFKHLWRLCEKNLGEKTEAIEDGRLIRQANTRMISGDSKGQCKAQYGRILPDATQKLINEILKVEADDVFVDIGHGIGNAVLQAAYTIGCEARGIEVVGDRNFIAKQFQDELDDLRRIRRDTFDDPRGDHVGQVDLRHGRLELPEFRDFLTNPGRRTKAFVNNFDGVFAERSAKAGQNFFLDHFIAGLFAVMEPGSIMVTLHPLTLGLPLENANELRRKHGLEESNLSSFFLSETVILGEAREVVSWSQGGSCRKPIRVWVYTRVEQPTNGEAVFLCLNPKCQKAQDMEPQPAAAFVDADGEENRLVVTECTCGVGSRSLRTRRKVDYGHTEHVLWPF